MEYLIEYGFLGMFVAAFLAATILPLSSEILLSSLLLADLNPVVLVLTATLGNVLGSIVNYFIGFYGGDWIRRDWLKISDAQFEQTRVRYEGFGRWSLLLAWVPVIGDPLTVVAGVLKISFGWFLLLVSVGKFLRYLVISYSVLMVTA